MTKRVKTMLPNSKKTVISRRQAVALAAGVAAFMSEARVMAQTNPPELSRVEPIQVELDAKRRKTMSYTVSELLLRNLRDVFGEIITRHLALRDPRQVFPGYQISEARFPGLFS